MDIIRFAFGSADRSKGAAINFFLLLDIQIWLLRGQELLGLLRLLIFCSCKIFTKRDLTFFLFLFMYLCFMFLMHLVVRGEREGRQVERGVVLYLEGVGACVLC